MRLVCIVPRVSVTLSTPSCHTEVLFQCRIGLFCLGHFYPIYKIADSFVTYHSALVPKQWILFYGFYFPASPQRTSSFSFIVNVFTSWSIAVITALDYFLFLTSRSFRAWQLYIVFFLDIEYKVFQMSGNFRLHPRQGKCYVLKILGPMSCHPFKIRSLFIWFRKQITSLGSGYNCCFIFNRQYFFLMLLLFSMSLTCNLGPGLWAYLRILS